MRRYLRWSTGVRWYLVVLAGTPLTILLGAMLLRGGSAWQSLALAGMPDLLMLVLTYLINVVVLMFLGGPLGEEGGWRGFALPRLQRQYSPLVASGILGLLWVTWHLPNFFIPEMGTFQGNLLVYLTLGGALSVIHSWVSNRTAQSLLMVTLLHAAVDASTRTLLPPIFGADRATGNLVPLIGFGAWALLIILATCARLGYHPSEHRA
jgi:membrane protease YdiL (CAAX protease family)